MRDLTVLFVHLIVTLARLLRSRGHRAIIAEALLLKHQILISTAPGTVHRICVQRTVSSPDLVLASCAPRASCAQPSCPTPPPRSVSIRRGRNASPDDCSRPGGRQAVHCRHRGGPTILPLRLSLRIDSPPTGRITRSAQKGSQALHALAGAPNSRISVRHQKPSLTSLPELCRIMPRLTNPGTLHPT